jgi:hypothetical protein
MLIYPDSPTGTAATARMMLIYPDSPTGTAATASMMLIYPDSPTGTADPLHSLQPGSTTQLRQHSYPATAAGPAGLPPSPLVPHHDL